MSDFNFMTDMADGGGIYTLGGNVKTDYKEPINFLCYNIIVVSNITGNNRGMFMPYYHDGASSNWSDENNLLVLNPQRKQHTPFYIQNISGQEVYNVFVKNLTVVGLIPEDSSVNAMLKAVYGFAKVYDYFACRVDDARNITQYRTRVLASSDEMDENDWNNVNNAGSDLYKVDVDAINAIFE